MKKYRTRITLEIVFDGDEVDDPALWDYAMLFDLVGEDSVRVLGSETERVVEDSVRVLGSETERVVEEKV